MSKEDWISTLRLGNMWQMDTIRSVAIHQLQLGNKLDAVQKVEIARECSIRTWEIGGLNQLIRERETMTMKHVERLGIETVLKICAARETKETSFNKKKHFVERGVLTADYTEKVKKDFGFD